MDKKQYKRNLNTKMEIANAFKELSKKKPMNKISINDLIITSHIEENNIIIDNNYKNFLIDFYSEGIASSIVNYFKGKQNIDRNTLITYLLSLKNFIPINI